MATRPSRAGAAPHAPSAREAVGRHRRGRVRPRHRPGVPQDRPRGPACPASVPARCRARCSRPASASPPPATRRCATPSRTTWPRPCASTTSTSSPPPRSRSPAAPTTARSSFDAVCEVRPVITVPGYGGLRVELPSPVGHRGRDRRSRRRRAPPPGLAGRRRPCGPVAATTSRSRSPATRDGEPVPGLNTEDWLYEVGKGWVAEGFDDQLARRRKPAPSSRSAPTPPASTSRPTSRSPSPTCRRCVLPEVTDEWVAENLGEFDTVEAWRASIAERIGATKLNQARNLLRRARHHRARRAGRRAGRPTAWCSGDLQARVQNTVQQFQSQGISIDQWLSGHRPGRPTRSSRRCRSSR